MNWEYLLIMQYQWGVSSSARFDYRETWDGKTACPVFGRSRCGQNSFNQVISPRSCCCSIEFSSTISIHFHIFGSWHHQSVRRNLGIQHPRCVAENPNWIIIHCQNHGQFLNRHLWTGLIFQESNYSTLISATHLGCWNWSGLCARHRMHR